MTRLATILLFVLTLLVALAIRAHAEVITYEVTFGANDVATAAIIITSTNLVTWTVWQSKGIDAGIAPTMKWTATNSEPMRFYRVIQTDQL